MTKFLNISTDNTLGGVSPSDSTVSSQKAIKDYVDAQIIESGGYHPGVLSWEWDDHLRNDVQWLRADTFSWQDGGVYEAAYDHLVDDYDSANWIIITGGTKYIRASGYDTTKGQYDYYGWKEYEGSDIVYTVDTQAPQINRAVYHSTSISLPAVYANVTDTPFIQETIENITVIYRVGTDGHKICLPGQESNVAATYAATGVAWYYILDTVNQRFKLPRAKHAKYADALGVVGNGVSTTFIKNINGAVSEGTLSSGMSVGGYAADTLNATGVTATTGLYPVVITSDPTKSGMVAQQEQDTDQYKYLYFYVGNFTQTALENTAGLNAELFNDKADRTLNNVSAGIDFVVETQMPTALNNYTWYRKYKSGWVEQGSSNPQNLNTIVFPIEMADTNYTATCMGGGHTGTGADVGIYIETKSTTGFTFQPDRTTYVNWQVSGKAA